MNKLPEDYKKINLTRKSRAWTHWHSAWWQNICPHLNQLSLDHVVPHVIFLVSNSKRPFSPSSRGLPVVPHILLHVTMRHKKLAQSTCPCCIVSSWLLSAESHLLNPPFPFCWRRSSWRLMLTFSKTMFVSPDQSTYLQWMWSLSHSFSPCDFVNPLMPNWNNFQG